MAPGNIPDSDNLDRLRDLLAGLGGEPGNGDLLGWVGSGDIADVPEELYGVIGNTGLRGKAIPRYPRPAAPALCQQLNQTATHYPGTELTLRYEVKDHPGTA